MCKGYWSEYFRVISLNILSRPYIYIEGTGQVNIGYDILKKGLIFVENIHFYSGLWYTGYRFARGRRYRGADMELRAYNGEGIDSWNEVTLIYNAALRQVETKMEILNDEFQHVHRYNPIEHIKARIKTPESIVKKLKRHGYESTIDNMVRYINDIAGIRIICSFTSDIYTIVDRIKEQGDIKVIAIKDYIMFPKASGYKSYHMIVTVPVYLSGRIVDTKVEIQIRTVAMDFWASLEHKIHYKFEGDAPGHIKNELVECAKLVSDLDIRMLKLNEEILAISQKEKEGRIPHMPRGNVMAAGGRE